MAKTIVKTLTAEEVRSSIIMVSEEALSELRFLLSIEMNVVNWDELSVKKMKHFVDCIEQYVFVVNHVKKINDEYLMEIVEEWNSKALLNTQSELEDELRAEVGLGYGGIDVIVSNFFFDYF